MGVVHRTNWMENITLRILLLLLNHSSGLHDIYKVPNLRLEISINWWRHPRFQVGDIWQFPR